MPTWQYPRPRDPFSLCRMEITSAVQYRTWEAESKTSPGIQGGDPKGPPCRGPQAGRKPQAKDLASDPFSFQMPRGPMRSEIVDLGKSHGKSGEGGGLLLQCLANLLCN